MARLVDTGLWIDLTRARSPQTLKNFIAPYINDPDTFGSTSLLARQG